MILGTLSIAIILIEPRGLWGLLRKALGGDLIPISHAARAGFGEAKAP